MIRRWIRSHRSLVATATSGFLVAALVAAVAIVSTGYTAQRLDLGDASVWVSNGEESFIGRANTEVLELNSVVAGAGSDLDVVQRGSTVVMFDRADATLEIVDAATSEVSDSVPLPPDQPGVFLAGDNTVVYSEGSGEVWIMPTADLGDFDAELEPTLSVGADSVVSVDENGLLFAFSPEAREVYRVDAAGTGSVTASDDTELGGDSGSFAITSVAGRWAVLDLDANQLELADGVVDLGAAVDEGPELQVASATGDSVLVAHSAGLVEVPFAGDDVTVLAEGGAGTTAAPVVLGGCAFAAWSNGQAWRLCDDSDEPTVLQLDMPGNAALGFKVNGTRLLLNDAVGGASWAVQEGGELIDNWDDLINVDEDQEQVEQNDENTPPEIEKNQLPPVAVDDDFGARPGRSSVLPVLLNDYDPNADVIVVSAVDAIDEAVGRIDLIENGQELQLTLTPGAQGTVSFGYTIDDGRGGSATATVNVVVRQPGENSPPQQVRNSQATVASSAQVTVPVLDDWIDPDGDPFYLASASVASPMAVSYKPEGTVIVTDGGTALGASTVSLVVSDGSATANGSLTVTTRAPGDVPIIADPFVVPAYSGEEITISPLEHVRGGNGAVRLNAVPAKTGVTITPSYEAGTFRFSTDEIRSHYVEFVVTDNDQTVTGLVRVDVTAPPDANTAPITIPKTVFIPTLNSRTVDVAGTDIDPAGGVLLVTGVVGVPEASGIRAEVLEQRSVRVTLTGPLAGPVSFGYRITNGLAEAQGTITVVEVAPPERLQPPIARDDAATVRVGDAITIDVMSNDEQPDGEPMTLNPVLVDGLSGDSGLLFVAGDTLRYLAPATTGNFTAVYELIGPLGQTAQAQVTIEVREPNADTNHAPVPVTVTARVIAGDTVTIDIPLDGIDPDGDSVQLLGQETSPEKGGVVAVGTSTIEYEAGVYSAGTDTFTYTVSDTLGARATGTVRIGISPPLADARNPVAIEDEVNVRPGATVSVQVLANDSDPDGSALRVVSVQPNDENLTATIDDDETIVDIAAPETPGSYGLVYTIANEIGGSSSNFVTVIVSEDAPRAYPVARDTVLSLTDVLDRTTINVDVLANVFFADGPVSGLDLSIVSGYDTTARVTGNKQIAVTIAAERQIIPFAVTNPDDSSARSYAFIWVPGFKDGLPQLNRDAPRLQVVSEETLTIELNDYVLAVDGRRVRITDSSTVRATHSDGSSLVVDSNTLSFRSADLYFGPASISFEVTDGASANDPAGRKASLVLPITVNPRENQPPVFTGATIEFEPGQEKVVDLTQVTNYPYTNDVDELAYSVLAPFPDGFDYELEGQSLRITARETVAKNTATAINLGVRDALAQGQPGRIQLRVVPSTRPLAVPAGDTAVARRGGSAVVDVLANDQATNPFPGQPLRVVAVRGIDGASLPAGLTVTASSDNSRLTVNVGGNAAPVDTLVQYQVSDASRDPDRNVWGSVRISVQDVPDVPAKPVRQANSFGDDTLTLRMVAPQPNNSPITTYRVVSAAGNYSHDCGTALICALPGLTIGEPYRLQVIAVNAIGESARSPESDPYTVDYLPAAPEVTAVPAAADLAPAGGAVTVSWQTVPDPRPGTPVTGYSVEFNGETRDVGRTATSTTFSGLPTATEYSVRVYARNSAQVSSSSDWIRSASRTVTTVGLPTAPAQTPAAASGTDGSITVTWGAFGANGGGTPTYSVRRVETGTAAPTACVSPTASGVGTGWTDRGLADGASYTYYVFADNGRYCSIASTGPAESKLPPGVPNVTAALSDRDGAGQLDIRAGGSFTVTSGFAARFEYRIDGGWAAVSSGQWLTSAANAGVYGNPQTVQFRACRDASESYCGPVSQTTLTPLNARSVFESCTAANLSDPGSFFFRAPNSGEGQSVSFEASFNRPLADVPTNWEAYEPYTRGDPVPSGTTAVRLRTTATAGVQSWSHVIENTCVVPVTPPETTPTPNPTEPGAGPVPGNDTERD
jgi:hypothetical protein